MTTKNTIKNIIVVFDESGTPKMADDKRTDWFLAVGVAYEQSAEDMIFCKCKDAFSLSNSQPLKNYRISNSRAVRIANLLADVPVSICVSKLNTADPTFRNMIIDYECLTKKARELRQARGRSIAQIIHSQALDHCLFHLITGCFEAGEGDAAFALFIDDWSIPKNDTDIYLEDRATSLEHKISLLCEKYHMDQTLSIARLELLNTDTSRKRFVDVVASTFSRAYLKRDHPNYSYDAARILQECGKARCRDATKYSIELMHKVMNDLPSSSNQRL